MLVDNWLPAAESWPPVCKIIIAQRSSATDLGQRDGTKRHSLEGGNSLKLTVATYWRPNEINIHRSATAKEEDDWGVKPDKGFEVRLSQEDQLRAAEERRDRDTIGTKENAKLPPLFDPPLDKAIEHLRLRQLRL